MRSLIRALLTTAIVSSPAVPAAAQVVVNGGAPNEGIGWNIFDDNRAAATFSLASATTFDAIRFWGLLPDGPAYAPDMYWEILPDVAGSPGASATTSGHGIAGSIVRTELGGFPGFFSWQFDLAAGEHTLASGVYWLALHDGPVDLLDPDGFTASSLIWETTDSGAFGIQTFSVDDHWDVVPDAGLAFELRETVVATPEPATVVLLATGLLGTIVSARRRRSR